MSLNIDIDSRINMFPLLLPRRRGQRLAQKLARARHGTAVLDLEQYAKDIKPAYAVDGRGHGTYDPPPETLAQKFGEPSRLTAQTRGIVVAQSELYE